MKSFLLRSVMCGVVSLLACYMPASGGQDPPEEFERPTASVPVGADPAKSVSVSEVGGMLVFDGTRVKGVSVDWVVSDPAIEYWLSSDKRKLMIKVPVTRLTTLQLNATGSSTGPVTIMKINLPGPNDPLPTPKPGPSPKPEPVKPDVPSPGNFGIGPKCCEWCKEVQSPDKPKECILVALALEKIMERIASEEITGVRALLKALTLATDSLGEDGKKRWEGWGDKWAGDFREHYNAGRFKTMREYSNYLKETVAGLKSVR